MSRNAASRRAAIEITLSAILAIIITVIVIWIVVANISPQVKMVFNSGKDIQGKKYFEIQTAFRLCQAWYQADFMDTVNVGVDKAFSDLDINKNANANAVCSNQKANYSACVAKCIALMEIRDACAKLDDRCYAIDAGFHRRCDLEGCVE